MMSLGFMQRTKWGSVAFSVVIRSVSCILNCVPSVYCFFLAPLPDSGSGSRLAYSATEDAHSTARMSSCKASLFFSKKLVALYTTLPA